MKILNQKSLDDKLRQAGTVVPGPLVNEVKDFLLYADDAQLYHINPYRFAAQRKLDRTPRPSAPSSISPRAACSTCSGTSTVPPARESPSTPTRC
jgi:hypothetical protein